MIKDLSILALIDNVPDPQNDQLKSEHGLSFWITVDGKHILYDTGQSTDCCHNASLLGVDIGKTGFLVLSHGHYDHTGAIPEVLEYNRNIKIFCHAQIFSPRYSFHKDGSVKPVGIANRSSESLNSFIDKIKWVTKPLKTSSDIGITGPIPRVTSFEDTGGSFFLDPDCIKPDFIEDDMALWFKTDKGLVIVTGCCHSGLTNTIIDCKKISGCDSVQAIIGGFHLVNASENRLDQTCKKLEEHSVKKIYPFHCTGEKAVNYLKSHSGIDVIKGYTGLIINCEL